MLNKPRLGVELTDMDEHLTAEVMSMQDSADPHLIHIRQ